MCCFCEPKIAPDKIFMTRSFSREARKFRLTSHSVLSAFIAFIPRPLLNHIFLFVTWISKYLACGYWGTSKAHSSDRYKLRVRFEVLALVFWGHLFYLDVHLQFNLDVSYIWLVFLFGGTLMMKQNHIKPYLMFISIKFFNCHSSVKKIKLPSYCRSAMDE